MDFESGDEQVSQWKLVPVEPTREMIEAWHRAYESQQWRADSWDSAFSVAHKAMLAAAPEPAQEPVATMRAMEGGGREGNGGGNHWLEWHRHIQPGTKLYAAPPTNLSDARDAQRLRYVSDMMDGIGDIDFHERAYEHAQKAGADIANLKPGDDYYLAAVRDAIDAAALAAQGGTSK